MVECPEELRSTRVCGDRGEMIRHTIPGRKAPNVATRSKVLRCFLKELIPAARHPALIPTGVVRKIVPRALVAVNNCSPKKSVVLFKYFKQTNPERFERDNGMRKKSPGRPRETIATASQQRVLDAYQDFFSRAGSAPTYRELAEALGLPVSVVYNAISRLERNGYLVRTANKRRSIEVVKSGDDADASLAEVPLVGLIAAGQPVLAPENIEGTVQVDRAIVKSGTYFALKVKGTSMIDAGIRSGDVAIVRQQVLADHRDIVVALLNNESTLKRLYHKDGEVKLLPENKRLKPIVVGPDDEFRIVGKVITVLHRSI